MAKSISTAHAGIGTSLPRIDAREKVLGTGQYVDDMHFKDMLYGAMLRTKYPRALVKSIDVSAARAYPGVEAVLTAADVPGERYGGGIFKDWPVLVAAGEETRCSGAGGGPLQENRPRSAGIDQICLITYTFLLSSSHAASIAAGRWL
ncbi:Nicotinate dehydrogenase large molybdopterin subunit [Pelotomaculum schinkii]|uniref:Nicotinate dehydrogenase large molybdopterin subunit n=1 Tax=Pelotomaculum schinkii TaxID=78350 RepID=A0A4Y7R9W7_9FIRM|nr:Nicotinate dehydrogenase large molybdopterin subunit [Pelotomaculum schinkii]